MITITDDTKAVIAAMDPAQFAEYWTAQGAIVRAEALTSARQDKLQRRREKAAGRRGTDESRT